MRVLKDRMYTESWRDSPSWRLTLAAKISLACRFRPSTTWPIAIAHRNLKIHEICVIVSRSRGGSNSDDEMKFEVVNEVGNVAPIIGPCSVPSRHPPVDSIDLAHAGLLPTTCPTCPTLCRKRGSFASNPASAPIHDRKPSV